MDDALGLLLLLVYIVAIVGLAAAITYAVIRIFPTERNSKRDKDDSSPPPRGEESSGGRLFRKAKREAT